MIGGTFQGSSTANFSAGVVNLFQIAAAPVYGALTTASVSSKTPFQYVRYLGPGASYCNISELEFDGTTLSNLPLPFNASGTAGSWQNAGNGFAKAFDGNLNTFFDAPTGSGNYLGATFSSEAIISQIQYAPAGSVSKPDGGRDISGIQHRGVHGRRGEPLHHHRRSRGGCVHHRNDRRHRGV